MKATTADRVELTQLHPRASHSTGHAMRPYIAQFSAFSDLSGLFRDA